MKKKLFVKQRDTRDCGPCCLLSILRYYEGNVNLEKIRLDTKINNNGTTAFNIIMAARKYGLDGYGKKISILDNDLKLPVIAHILTKRGYEHFVVIYKVKKDKIIVMDPAEGFKRVRLSDFEKEWDGIILVLRPYKRIIHEHFNGGFINSVLSIIGQEKELFCKLLFDSIGIALLSLILAMYWQFAFSNGDNITDSFVYISCFFLIATILKNLVIKKKNYWQIVFNKRIDASLTLSFINHFFNLPLDIIRNRTTGEILTRINEIKEIKDLIANVLVSMILEFFLIACSIYVLLFINGRLFFVVVFLILLYILISSIAVPVIYKRTNDIIDLETDFNASLGENIERIVSIKNLNIGGFVLDKIQKMFFELKNSSFSYAKLINNYLFLRSFIYEIGLFAINTYGFYLIKSGHIRIVELITFNTVLSYIFGPITDIVDSIPKICSIKLAIIKLKEITGIDCEKIGEDNDFSNGLISFINISYSYNDYHKTLNNINLNINKGERLLIRGKSGIGKSTLLQLLNRNIENYTGDILINGINIKDYSLATIRKNIRYVSQRESLFTGTIRDNIIFDKEYSMDYINSILRITKLDEVLDKKELRLNTLIVDGGANISGGERQRIVLARAVIDKPPILILDEALNEVDARTEKSIMKQLIDFLSETTIIYISHHNNIENFTVFKLEEAAQKGMVKC